MLLLSNDTEPTTRKFTSVVKEWINRVTMDFPDINDGEVSTLWLRTTSIHYPGTSVDWMMTLVPKDSRLTDSPWSPINHQSMVDSICLVSPSIVVLYSNLKYKIENEVVRPIYHLYNLSSGNLGFKVYIIYQILMNFYKRTCIHTTHIYTSREREQLWCYFTSHREGEINFQSKYPSTDVSFVPSCVTNNLQKWQMTEPE